MPTAFGAYFPTVVYQIKLHIDYFLEFLPVERIWWSRLKEEMRSLTANEYNWSNSKISIFSSTWMNFSFVLVKNTEKPMKFSLENSYFDKWQSHHFGQKYRYFWHFLNKITELLNLLNGTYLTNFFEFKNQE